MKKFFIISCSLVIALALSAFAFQEKQIENKPVPEVWFQFIGVAGEEGIPSKYQQYNPQPLTPPCSAPVNDLCAIKIEPDGNGLPDFANNTASQTRYLP